MIHPGGKMLEDLQNVSFKKDNEETIENIIRQVRTQRKI
jgi:hypothetical protein